MTAEGRGADVASLAVRTGPYLPRRSPCMEAALGTGEPFSGRPCFAKAGSAPRCGSPGGWPCSVEHHALKACSERPSCCGSPGHQPWLDLL